MVMVERLGKRWGMDGYLETNLTEGVKRIREDWDIPMVVCGFPGVGKTVLTFQMASFVDPSFNIDRVVFSIKDFNNAIDNSEKYQAIVWDEAGDVVEEHFLSKQMRALKRKLSVCRKKNLWLYIIYPDFWDLPRNIAKMRTRALVRVYTHDTWKRGFFEWYGQEKKRQLWIQGKRYENYHTVKPNFKARFPNAWVIDREEYDKKKDAAEMERNAEGGNESERGKKYRAYLGAASRYLKKECKLPQVKIVKVLSEGHEHELTRQSISNWAKKGGVS